MSNVLTCVRTAKRENESYESFLESRKAGFGGSDIGDLLDSEPYGCKRRLFLGRLGLLPDGDGRLAHHLERGKFFEAPVAGLYEKVVGRQVKECGTGYLKQYPFVRANADRLVWDDLKIKDTNYREGWGVLEIKVPAAWSFRKIKKEGLPESYILQLQWQMLCYGTSWGSFAVYWPDGHELLWFDVARDDVLIQGLFERAQKDWAVLERMPDVVGSHTTQTGIDYDGLFGEKSMPLAHPSTYVGCQNCTAYELCHGFARAAGVLLKVPELEPDVVRYAELTAQLKALESEKDEFKQRIKDEFAKFPCDAIEAGPWVVNLREQSRESLSSDVKKELTAEQIVRYTKQTKFDVLTVKAVKAGKQK